MQTNKSEDTLINKPDRHNLVITAILLLAVFWLVAIYSDTIQHEFLHWDDIIYIVNNPYLHQLSVNNLLWMLTDYKTLNWHPLTWLSHNIDFLLYGKNPFFMKLTNIFLHVASCIVLFFLFRTLLDILNPQSEKTATRNLPWLNTYASILAISIFAIHPQHIESVVWVAERKDVLCSFFYFSTLLFYLKFHVTRQRTFFNIALLCAVLATMSKPMAVSIPLALIMLDILVLKRMSGITSWSHGIRNLIGEKFVLIGLSIFIACITLFTQSAAIKDLETLGIISRIINASIATLHYLGSVVLPVNLSPLYPYKDMVLQPGILSALPVASVIIVIAACFMLWKRGNRLYLIAMSFFLLSIIPVIGIVSVGHQAYADRYTYVPTSLFYLAICNSLVTFLARPMLSKPVKYSVSVVLIGLYCTLGFISAAQVKDWKNDESLWSAVIRKYPEQIFLAHQNLGNAYLSQRRYSEAITQYQIALQLNDNSAKTHENLGRAYGNTGEKDKEIEQYLLAIKKDNNSIWPRLFAGYFYLANRNVLLASEQFTQALRLDPLSAPAIIANTKIDILQQQYDTAKKRLSELLEHTPNQTEAIWMLAQLYYREGNTHDTQILLKKILSLAPDNKPAKDLLAKINQLNN